MSTLTKQERDGLEDVFLSISSNSNKYRKLKELSSLIMAKDISLSLSSLLKQAKHGINELKSSHFLTKNSKKKRNLRK